MRTFILLGVVAGALVASATRTAAAASDREQRNQQIAQAAAKILIDAAQNPEKYRQAWSKMANFLMGDEHHAVYEWHDEGGVTFCVVPVGGGGSRLTLNISHAAFADRSRRVEFHLVHVREEDLGRVYWEVKSDVPGRGDGHRQLDGRHKTRHGDTITVVKRAGKDYAFYLAGRWDSGLSQPDWLARNPNAAVLLILRD